VPLYTGSGVLQDRRIQVDGNPSPGVDVVDELASAGRHVEHGRIDGDPSLEPVPAQGAPQDIALGLFIVEAVGVEPA